MPDQGSNRRYKGKTRTKKKSLVRGYNILAKRARILLRKDERERERDESRREKARGRAISRATTVPQALISSIISFGDAADRWWVQENERESISGNQPPPGCVLPLAGEEGNGNAEKR